MSGMKKKKKKIPAKADIVVKEFSKDNKQKGLRVFVAGGSRSGNDDIYVEEAYNLGRKIVSMGFKLDFGLSNTGIMGAVARGVLDGWNKVKQEEHPIQGITTKEYYDLYSDEVVFEATKVFVAQTLEERKQRLLEADFVVFAPGGVGTLDELAYDLVAMQDGFLSVKPFIIYNINGFFHHILEYLKEIYMKGFADPISFIVVDNSEELSIVFRLLKLRYSDHKTTKEAYTHVRQLIYELPYFVKRKMNSHIYVEDIIDYIADINKNGTAEQRQYVANEIEQAYLEKEIERMYDRLGKAGQDTAQVSEKLTKLKVRKKNKRGY
jgi:hypothetical protein